MLCSLCYLGSRCLLQLVLLRPRSEEFKELESIVLGHELTVLRRQALLRVLLVLRPGPRAEAASA